jgi:hypothetical protein
MRPSAYAGMLIAASLAVATPALAQSSEWTIDVSLFRGTVGYAQQVTPRAMVGIEVGIGIPETSHTLTPAHDQPGFPDFSEFLHLGVFARSPATQRFNLDTGLRISVADLWICSASDCWPALFAGAYVQPMFGWKRVKFGGHLIAGWVNESRESSAGSTFTIAINPLIARVTF